jgi:hypothetical protein
MRASWYRLEDADDGSRSIIFTPGEKGRTRCVGFVRPLPGGGFRARGTETGLIAVDDIRTWAAARVLPDDGFPELCVRCGVNEPTYDAAACGPYPSDLDDVCEDCLDLDDVCEDCLPEALADWSEG